MSISDHVLLVWGGIALVAIFIMWMKDRQWTKSMNEPNQITLWAGCSICKKQETIAAGKSPADYGYVRHGMTKKLVCAQCRARQ